MKVIIVIIFISLVATSFSQEGKWWQNEDTTKVQATKDTIVEKELEPGKVEVIKDKRIEKLIDFKSTTIPPATAPQTDGYRVQLFFDQDKSKVNEARAKVLEIDSGFDTYIEYDAPNYNLLLGNYRTNLEAEKLRSELREDFPAAIIVKSRIYFPDLLDEED